MGQNPGTVREHQNRWDLWMFIHPVIWHHRLPMAKIKIRFPSLWLLGYWVTAFGLIPVRFLTVATAAPLWLSSMHVRGEAPIEATIGQWKAARLIKMAGFHGFM